MPVESSVLQVLEASEQGKLEELKKSFEEADYVLFKVYALPRPELRIRTAKKKLLELDDGRMARLEYSLVRCLIEAATRRSKPTFKEFAELVGDYKAAAGYITYLWRAGLVHFDDHSRALDLYTAFNSMSRKRYERAVSRALDATFALNKEAFSKLPSDTLTCIYRNGEFMCKYIVVNTERSQAKAQVRACRDVLSKSSEAKK